MRSMSSPSRETAGSIGRVDTGNAQRAAERSARSPLISVAVATYNRRPYLADLFACLEAQTFDDWELVLVDDGSSDGTADEVAALDVGHLDVHYVRQENQGLCVARNTGIEHAAGTYVVFLDDDDRPTPGWLSSFAAAIDTTNAGYVSCGVILFDEEGRDYGLVVPERLGAVFEGVIANYLPGSFCARRDLLLDIGGFLPGLQASHQTELVIRLFPRCIQADAPILAVHRLLHRMERRRPENRREQNPQQLLDALDTIYAHHRAKVRSDKVTYATWESMAGVAAARLGDLARARRRLVRAVLARPSEVKHWARLAISLVPPLSRRVWGQVDRPASR